MEGTLTPFGTYCPSIMAPGLNRGNPVLLLGSKRSDSSRQACKNGSEAEALGVMS